MEQEKENELQDFHKCEQKYLIGLVCTASQFVYLIYVVMTKETMHHYIAYGVWLTVLFYTIFHKSQTAKKRKAFEDKHGEMIEDVQE